MSSKENVLVVKNVIIINQHCFLFQMSQEESKYIILKMLSRRENDKINIW